MRILVLTAVAAAMIGAGAAAAQAPAAPAATTTSRTTHKATSTVRAPAKPRTAASLDCSKQADAKNLHRKEREKFRKSCVKAAK